MISRTDPTGAPVAILSAVAVAVPDDRRLRSDEMTTTGSVSRSSQWTERTTSSYAAMTAPDLKTY